MKQKTVFIFTIVVSLYALSISHTSSASTFAAPSTPAATLSATSAATTTAVTSANHILYQKNKDTTCDLYSSDLDGNNSTCIAQNLFSEAMADAQKAAKAAKFDVQSKDVVSNGAIFAKPTPNGSKFLILATADIRNRVTFVLYTASRLYLLDRAAGTPPTLLFQSAGEGLSSDKHGHILDYISAEMSPDGTQFAYVIPGQDQIFVASLDGTSPRQISQKDDAYSDIAWSPDGKRILVSATGKASVFDVTATKGKPQILALSKTDQTAFYTSFTWSPDGQQALIVEGFGPLYRYSFSDKKVLKLSVDKMQADLAYWSPDGQKILFSAQPDDTNYTANFYTVNPDGSGLQKLVEDIDAFRFGFAPDGSHIFYSDKDGIVLAEPDGKNAQVIVKGATLIAITGTTKLRP